MDFYEGEKVILIDSPGAVDDWTDITGVVRTTKLGVQGIGDVAINPTVDRPDGHRRTFFMWPAELIVKVKENE